MLSFTLYQIKGRLKSLKFQHWNFPSTIQLSFSKEYSHVLKMSLVGYLTLATCRVWLILYKLRLSHMGSDVGQIFLTAS